MEESHTNFVTQLRDAAASPTKGRKKSDIDNLLNTSASVIESALSTIGKLIEKNEELNINLANEREINRISLIELSGLGHKKKSIFHKAKKWFRHK